MITISLLQELKTTRKNEIESFCKEQGISIDKVFRCACSYNDEFVAFQRTDPDRDKTKSKMDDKPSEILLYITKGEEGLSFNPGDRMIQFLK